MNLIISGDSSVDFENEENTDNEDTFENYDVRFARYKERVKDEEHFYYNSVKDNSSNESTDSDD